MRTEKPRRKGQWREELLTPCPSDAAYKRHLKRGEYVDQGCRDAHAVATAQRRNRSPTEMQVDRRRKALRRQAVREALEALRHRHPHEYELLRHAALTELAEQEAERGVLGQEAVRDLLEEDASEPADPTAGPMGAPQCCPRP